jgi:hypothetical protein
MSISEDEVYCLIGRVSRLVEEAGVHGWAIYPIDMQYSEEPVVRPSLYVRLDMYEKDTKKVVQSCFSFPTDLSVEHIEARLLDAMNSIKDLIEEDQLELVPNPRRFQRVDWDGLIEEIHDEAP